MNTSTQKFSEFISDENGEFRMRLSSSEYIQKNGEIYRVSKSGYLFLIEADKHAQKPWICQNFNREIKFQERKHLAAVLQRTHIPQQERRAYKKRMGWVGA